MKTISKLLISGLGLLLATTSANAQAVSHSSTTVMNVEGSDGANGPFRISVKAGNAKYVQSAAAGGASGALGDGTLLDWQIHTAVNNESPFKGSTVSAGPGTYFDTPTCADSSVGGPQNYFDVWEANDIDTQASDIPNGTTPAVGNGLTPITGNIDISGLTDGQVYVLNGTYRGSLKVNLTMTGPGKSPIVMPEYAAPNPGFFNKMYLMKFTFSNPGGGYTNIKWSSNNGQNNTGRRRWGGVFLDGTILVDTTPPNWVATYPNASTVSSTLFTLNGNTNENSTAYYVVLSDGATPPASAEVKAGTGASASTPLASGSFALSGLVPGSKMVTGLTASTAYDVYVVAEDVRGPNLQAAPVLVEVTTTAPDVTAPNWTATYPQQSRTPAGLTGIGNLDEPGIAYFVALPSGASAPTSAQVKAGTDASGDTAPSGSMSLLTPGVSGGATIAGLTIGATHDVWFVAEDLLGNLQAAPTSVASVPAGPFSQFATGGFAWGTASVWSATTGGPYTGPWGSGNNAVFEGGAGPVAIASGTVVNNITFNSNNWILQGGPLTLAGTAQPEINVNIVSGNAPKLEAPLAGTQGFIKSGSGTLQMTGNNSITGGFVINGGWLNTEGATAGLNNNDITANTGAVGLTLAGGTTTNGGIAINASMLNISNNNSSITVNGPVTGAGGITLIKTGDGQNLVSLLSTSNTFTGGVDYTGNRNTELNVNSFADSATPGTGNIRFGVGNPATTTTPNRFALQSGATSPVTLTNRQFEIASANNYPAQIYNNSAQAFTINSDLIVSGTSTKTLELGGAGAGTSSFAGDLVNGSGTLVLTKSGSGTWALGGDNTYTGTTTVSAGTLLINGNQSLATGAVAVNGTSTLGGSGTIGGTVTTASGAKLAPGNAAAGTLAIASDLNISAMAGGAGKLNFELDALAGTNDKIAVTGTLIIGVDALGFNDFVFTNLGGLEVTAGTPYKLITSGAINPGDTLDPASLGGSLPGGFNGTLQITANDIELVVTPNVAPGISDITDQTVPAGFNTGALDFTITDEEVNTVIPSGSSTNTTLVPDDNIVFGGSGANRTVTVTTVPGLTGSATITVTITDIGGLTAIDTFELTVTVAENYLSWATANSVTGGQSGDSDNDGVMNLVEYALVDGGERGVLSGNTITFTKRGAPYGIDLTYTIETSETLESGSWTAAVTHGPELLGSNPTISYTFTPSTPVRKFARLKVTAID